MNKNLIILTMAGYLLTACVTINIYFPAAATEKAADKIIDEVWQLQNPEQTRGGDIKPADNNANKETK